QGIEEVGDAARVDRKLLSERAARELPAVKRGEHAELDRGEHDFRRPEAEGGLKDRPRVQGGLRIAHRSTLIVTASDTVTGNATLSIVCSSHQSAWVTKSTRSIPSYSATCCVKNEEGKFAVGKSFFTPGFRPSNGRTSARSAVPASPPPGRRGSPPSAPASDPPARRVDELREQDDETDDHLLNVRADVQEVEPVSQHRDQHRAQKRP